MRSSPKHAPQSAQSTPPAPRQRAPIELRQAMAAPRAARPEAILALQRTIGNQAVQRIIKVNQGGDYGQDTIKPSDPAALQKAKSHPNPFLVKSPQDFEKLEQNQLEGISILPPAKHLIGETHAKSKFYQAAEDWSWGATKMVETLSSHPRKRDYKNQTKARKEHTETEYEALPLEDTIAKDLGVLNVLAYAINGFHQNQDKLKNKTLTGEERKVLLEKHTPCIRDFIHKLRPMQDSLLTYKEDSQKSIKEGRGEFPGVTEIEVLENIKDRNKLVKKYKGNLDETLKRKDVDYAFYQIDEIKNLIEVLINACLAIAKGDNPSLYEKMKMDERRNSFVSDPVSSADPLRDHYMAENIRDNLSIPGLVKLGKSHAKRLESFNIPQAVLYQDYKDFKESTDARKVLNDDGMTSRLTIEKEQLNEEWERLAKAKGSAKKEKKDDVVKKMQEKMNYTKQQRIQIEKTLEDEPVKK